MKLREMLRCLTSGQYICLKTCIVFIYVKWGKPELKQVFCRDCMPNRGSPKDRGIDGISSHQFCTSIILELWVELHHMSRYRTWLTSYEPEARKQLEIVLRHVPN